MSDNMNYTKTVDEFYSYMLDLLNLYDESVLALRDKLEAIAGDDLEGLNRSIQAQQVFLLKTKTFDGKLEGFMAKLGISAKTLSETIGQLPEEHHLRFYDLLGRFELTLKEVRYYNEKCQTLLQTKLYMIDKKLRKADVAQQATMYQNNARETRSPSQVQAFETKI